MRPLPKCWWLRLGLAALVLQTRPGKAEAADAAPVVPLVAAHAHNDYLHARPLLDALDQGFCSVEADVYLVDGKLLVAHDRSRTRPDRTLQSLYLDPLRQRIRQNGGRVYRNGPEFTLLIDLKSSWREIYPPLRKVLQEYDDIFTSFNAGTKRTNAVLAIISGTRALEMFAGETVRYAAYDGELPELDSKESADLIPWISTSWGSQFKWRGTGAMTTEDQNKLTDLVQKTHAQGRRLRFWGGPDKPEFWEMLRTNHVDLINTDDLARLKRFLTNDHGLTK